MKDVTRLLKRFGILGACLLSKAAFGSGLYGDVNLHAGYSSTSVPSGSSTPTLIQLGGGGTLAYKFGDVFFLGVSSDYSFINQYSDVDTSVGNRRGTHWAMIMPSVGANFSGFTIKGNFEFWGNYYLYSPDVNGASIIYNKPIGFSIQGLIPIVGMLNLGAMFQWVRFGSQYSSISGDQAASNPFVLWQAGLMAALVF